MESASAEERQSAFRDENFDLSAEKSLDRILKETFNDFPVQWMLTSRKRSQMQTQCNNHIGILSSIWFLFDEREDKVSFAKRECDGKMRQ